MGDPIQFHKIAGAPPAGACEIGGELHYQERRQEILRLVAERQSCRVIDLARELSVSDETIRRDVKRMVGEGLVSKVHGGVLLADPLSEPEFHQRLVQHVEAKKRIAELAAQQVRNGDSIMLDTGSTTAFVARALRHHRNLLVVTNSVDIARTLATRNGNRVYMAGGELRAGDGAALGASAITFIEQFRVRLVLLSIGAIDLQDGMMDYNLDEAEFSRVAMQRADRTVIVADHSKFGRRALVTVAGLDAAQMLISDRPPPPAFLERLQRSEAIVLVANKQGQNATPR